MSVVFFNDPVTGIYFDAEQPAIFVDYRVRQAEMIREDNDIVLARENEHFCFRRKMCGIPVIIAITLLWVLVLLIIALYIVGWLYIHVHVRA